MNKTSFRKQLMIFMLIFTIIFSNKFTVKSLEDSISNHAEFKPEDRYLYTNSTNELLILRDKLVNRSDDIVRLEIQVIENSIPIAVTLNFVNEEIQFISSTDKITHYNSLIITTNLMLEGSKLIAYLDWNDTFNETKTDCDICTDIFYVSKIYLSLESEKMWNFYANITINVFFMDNFNRLNSANTFYIDTSNIVTKTTSNGISLIFYPIIIPVIAIWRRQRR